MCFLVRFCVLFFCLRVLWFAVSFGGFLGFMMFYGFLGVYGFLGFMVFFFFKKYFFLKCCCLLFLRIFFQSS